MSRKAFAFALWWLCASVVAQAQQAPAASETPPEAYGAFRQSASLSWHPIRREVLVRQEHEGGKYVQLLSEPGARARPLAALPDGDAAFQPTTGEYFIFTRTARLHRFDFATKATTPLGPERETVVGFAWSRKGDRLIYATQVPDRAGRIAQTRLRLVEPLQPETDKLVATLEGSGWDGLAFSPDDRRVALRQVRSERESHLWTLDLATGKRERASRARAGERVRYGPPHFLADGKSLLATSDRGDDFRRLVQITLADGREYNLTPRHKFDVDDVAVSFDAKRIAFTTNEHGSHVLRFLDLDTKKEQTRPPLFDGVIGGLAWRRLSGELAFTVSSARTAGDAFSFDVALNALTRWTNGNNPAVNTSRFPEPRLVKWKSFDGREVSGFLYDPPEQFKGSRPVLVLANATPGSQARAGFLGRYNYLVNELGVALIFANPRGASGFGKAFARLGEGEKRKDASRDLIALLAWIKSQPGFDGDRIIVTDTGADFAATLEAVRARLVP